MEIKVDRMSDFLRLVRFLIGIFIGVVFGGGGVRYVNCDLIDIYIF